MSPSDDDRDSGLEGCWLLLASERVRDLPLGLITICGVNGKGAAAVMEAAAS